MKRLRALVLCPGRGSYQRPELGSISQPGAAVAAFDAWRISHGRPSVTELDQAPRFQSALHVAGENASALTAAISLTDLEQLDGDKVEVVAVCGNSMGWYTALSFAGALPLEDGVALVDTMGAWQAESEHGVVGGQLVYPLVDGAWLVDPARASAVDEALRTIPDLYWSIRLGGQAVLGGTEEAVATAVEQLPRITGDRVDFPLRLPLHSAFHTPLLRATADRAGRELAHLDWQAPRVPMVDGRGATWRPRWSDPHALRDYTLGAQVCEPFDFSLMLRTALCEYAPDVVVLPGPGSNLGGAVAQVIIAERWRGITDKESFVAAQADAPVMLSMRWPDQRSRLVRTA
jgi:[acyl-carrier-protein] S-malonyltransferase